MNVFGATLMVIMFAVLLHVLGLVQRTKEVVAIGQAASRTLRDASLSDSEKEHRMQQNSLALFRLLAVLILGTFFALAIPLAVIWVLQLAGILSVKGVLQMLARWDFIVGATFLGILVYVAAVKWLTRSS